MKIHKLYLIALLLPGSASSADFLYDAEVISVKQLIQHEQTTNTDVTCFEAKPQGFTQMLQWDVGCELPQYQEKTRYEVTYRVGSDEFTTLRDQQPGDSIKVKLNIVAAQHRFN